MRWKLNRDKREEYNYEACHNERVTYHRMKDKEKAEVFNIFALDFIGMVSVASGRIQGSEAATYCRRWLVK